MWLLWHFSALLRLNWRFRADPLETLHFVADLGWPLMSKRARSDCAEMLSKALKDDDLEAPATTAMLEAATRWFCLLDLPRTTEGLWAGPR